MAPRRVYSDPAVNGIVGNILQMINGSPEQALQQAELAKQVVGIDTARGQLDARDRLAQAFSGITSPNQIQPILGDVYGNSFQGNIDPARISAAILGITANGGGTNEQNAAAYVGGGHPIKQGDAFTVPRQDVITNNNERIGDERQTAALHNAFGIASMNEKGRNSRFYNTPVKATPGEIITAFDENHNPTVYNGAPTPNTVKGGVMQTVVDTGTMTPEQKLLLTLTGGSGGSGSGKSAVPLDISPADAMGDTSLSTMVDAMSGDAQIDDQTKIKVIQRAAEIYQQTRNSSGAVQQAISELTQPQDIPGRLWGSRGTQLVPKALSGPAAPAAPVVTPPSAAAQPQVVQDPAVVEGTIQQSKKDPTKYRIMRNGQWQAYQPSPDLRPAQAP